MWQVYFKELLELIRDKKTLFFVIALPLVIFPVLIVLMGGFVANVVLEEQHKVLRYSIVNAEQAPVFAETIHYHRDFKKVTVKFENDESIFDAINNGEVDVVIKVSPNHLADRKSKKQMTWQVYFNDASQHNLTEHKLKKILQPYTSEIQQEFLNHQKLTLDQLNILYTPLVIENVNTANSRENFGEKFGGFLPYLLIVLCMTGAMYSAIDIGAGEKERGTLETLLLSPLSVLSIVLGKFLTIMTTAMVTVLFTVISLVFWSYVIGEFANVNFVKTGLTGVSNIDLLLVVILLLPVAGIFASLLLAISIYARSFKEAQNYMGPLSLLGFVPVMVTMLPGISLTWGWSLVPISNVALAIKEIVKGTIDYTLFGSIFISSVIFAMLSILFCVYCFKKESVLFR